MPEPQPQAQKKAAGAAALQGSILVFSG